MSISVASKKWPYTVKLPKDPDATLDYQLDWSEWLSSGESISGLDVAVTGVTKVSSSFTATSTTAWVSGGTAGGTGTIRFRITTDSAPNNRIDDRTLNISIAQR